MNEQIEFLKLIAGRLDGAGIPYMMTGSMAMAVYAVPRMTRDIDLIIELSPDRADEVCALFSPDCYIDPGAVRRALESRGMFNIINNEWIIKADFIVRKNEPYREEEFRRRQRVEIDGVAVSVVSVEDLILSKLVWAKESRSEFQLRDVRQLLADVPSLEREYLESWAAILGVSPMWQEAQKRV